jgi:hypothetical protein
LIWGRIEGLGDGLEGRNGCPRAVAPREREGEATAGCCGRLGAEWAAWLREGATTARCCGHLGTGWAAWLSGAGSEERGERIRVFPRLFLFNVNRYISLYIIYREEPT